MEDSSYPWGVNVNVTLSLFTLLWSTYRKFKMHLMASDRKTLQLEFSMFDFQCTSKKMNSLSEAMLR